MMLILLGTKGWIRSKKIQKNSHTNTKTWVQWSK